MKVVFNGAAQEVTGSCTLIESRDTRFLVDCGMFQGGREASDKNRNRFAFEPSDIDFVLLTHAHIDHSGLLPKLYREGFRGPIHTTTATAELLEIMLRDSAHIQETEAKRRARRRRNRSKPLKEPIYTLPDAEAVLRQVRPVDYEERLQLQGGIDVRFRDAGHILGSAIMEIWVAEKGHSRKLVFSGDLGQPGRPILRDPTIIEEADILFIESTYGNRLHKNLTDTVDEFVGVVTETLQAKRGNVIIPAFAVGRTQELIYYFHQLACEGRLDDLDIFVDSPMATAVTELTSRHMSLFDEQARSLARWRAKGENIPTLKFVRSVEESRALNAIRAGAIIIAASGMCTAGRVKYHLLENLPRPESAVLITGFQAQGTLGRQLVDGADQVRIFEQDVPVRASIHTLNGFSAHADQAALLDWLDGFKKAPAKTFVVHGEKSSSTAFAEEIASRLGWKTTIPERGQIEEIA